MWPKIAQQRTSLKQKTALFLASGWASYGAIVLVGLAIVYINCRDLYWKEKTDHQVIASDIMYYYSYLPAAIIEHDLSFQFIYEKQDEYSTHISILKTPEGGIYQKMTMGLALLYLPFFLVGHAQALMSGAVTTGFSEPYYFWLIFSGLFYGMIALLVLRKIILRFFTDEIAAYVLLAIGLGTNLLYYLSSESLMSHGYNFFLFILFIWFTIKWHEIPKLKYSIIIGFVYGLIGLIRPTNGLIILFFLLYGVGSQNRLRQQARLFLAHWKQMLTLFIITLVVVFPQLLYWKTYTGHWFFYSYGEEGFFFRNPQIWRGLFSYRKGWLVYTPIMAFALAGLFSLRRYAPPFFVPTLVFIPLNIYLVYSWWDWSYGGSFGSRPMIDSYGLMAVALGALLTWADRHKKALSVSLKTTIVLLTVFSIFQTFQYKNAIIHYAYMSKKAYWASFGKLRVEAGYQDLMEPMNYSKLLKGEYATRPMLRQTIGPDALNEFEQIANDKMYFFSPERDYRFSNNGNQSKLQARSGENSALLTPEKPFSSGLQFYVKAGQKYTISAWKYPAKNGAGSLVFASELPDRIYQIRTAVDRVDPAGWGRISLDIRIPNDFDGWCKAYVWNKSADSVFFDDFKVQRIN